MKLLTGLACISLLLSFCCATIVDQTAFRQDTHWSGIAGAVALRFSPDGQAFVATKEGRILRYASINEPVESSTEVVNLESIVYNWWDRGLLGLEVHPNYPATPLLFAFFSVNRRPDLTSSDSNLWPKSSCPAEQENYCSTAARLIRIRVDIATNQGNVEQTLLSDWCAGSGSHHVGDLGWAPDGGLYLSAGDGASFDFADIGVRTDFCFREDDPRLQGSFRSQHDDYLHGKILYIQQEPLENKNALLTIDTDYRVVAKGFRNPFRFDIHPTTNDIYVGDVGSEFYEEINIIPNPLDAANAAGPIPNYGWPCFEGNAAQPYFVPGNYLTCTQLAASDNNIAPFFVYDRQTNLPTQQPQLCSAINSSPTGLHFYTGNHFNDEYQGLLFWVDGSKRCAFYFLNQPGHDYPDPTLLRTLVWTPAEIDQTSGQTIQPGQWVDIRSDNDGFMYLVDFFSSSVHRITAQGAETDPYPVLEVPVQRSLTTPFVATLDASKSFDLDDGDSISVFTWDFNNDGQADVIGNRAVASVIERTFLYGVHQVQLTVTDTTGRSRSTSVTISSGVTIDFQVSVSPPSHMWNVNDQINFSTTAVTDQGTPIPENLVSWSVVIFHCTTTECSARTDCHVHPVALEEDSQTGYSGSFRPFAHPLPSFWNITVSAKHPNYPGFRVSKQLTTHSETYQITLETRPMGLPLDLCDSTPCFRNIMAGSIIEPFAPALTSVSAIAANATLTASEFPAKQNTLYRFSHWDAPSRPESTQYRFTPSGDTILVAIFEEVEITATANSGISAPTDVKVAGDFGELVVSWGAPAAGADLISNYLVMYRETLAASNEATTLHAVGAGEQDAIVFVGTEVGEYSVSVAAVDSQFRLGSASPIQVASTTNAPVTATAKCLRCYDDQAVLSNFDSASEFDSRLTTPLRTVFGDDNSMTVLERQERDGEQMIRLVPNSDSYFYMILDRPGLCYDFQPSGLRWTSFVMDVITTPGASFELALRGHDVGCSGVPRDLVTFQYPADTNVSDFTGQRQTIKVNLNRLSIPGVSSISIRSFAGTNELLIDNVRFVRDCATYESEAAMNNIIDCGLLVENFENSQRVLLDQNLLQEGSLSSRDLSKEVVQNGILELAADTNGRWWSAFVPPGVCFDATSQAFEYVKIDIQAPVGSDIAIRLVLKRADCSFRDESNVYSVKASSYGFGISSLKTITIPLLDFRPPTLRRVDSIEFHNFSPLGETFRVDNIRLMQSCGVTEQERRLRQPTSCQFSVEDFSFESDSIELNSSATANQIGGRRFFTDAVTASLIGSLGERAMRLQYGLSTGEAWFTTYVHDLGRRLCIDLSFYSRVQFVLDRNDNIRADGGGFAIETLSRESDCDFSAAFNSSSSSVVTKQRVVLSSGNVRLVNSSLIALSASQDELSAIQWTNVYAVRLVRLTTSQVSEIIIRSVSFERDGCDAVSANTFRGSCDKLVINDFNNASRGAQVNNFNQLNVDDGTMDTLERTADGRAYLVPKNPQSYWINVLGECVDASRYTHLHVNVEIDVNKSLGGLDMKVALQKSSSCGSSLVDTPIGTVSDILGRRLDSRSGVQSLYLPLKGDKSQVSAVVFSEFTEGVLLDNVYFVGGDCVQEKENEPTEWWLIAVIVASSIIGTLLLCNFFRRLRSSNVEKKTTSKTSRRSSVNYAESRDDPNSACNEATSQNNAISPSSLHRRVSVLSPRQGA